MRHLLGLFIGLSLAGLSWTAPAPFAKPVKSLEVISGEYQIHWGSFVYPARLWADGGYSASFHNDLWEGSWTYNPVTRDLKIKERRVGANDIPWSCWSVVLDGQLKGKVCNSHGANNMMFSMKRIR